MYSFACLVLLELTRRGRLPDLIETAVVAALIIFFALAQGAYILHGLMRDTENQLALPHRFGSRQLPPWMITLFMLALILVEVTGFLILFIAALV